jgi:hypothetical protein
MNTIVRTHIDGSRDVLRVLPEDAAARWVDSVTNRDGDGMAWAQVPPAGSAWEDAEWDALAHRAGVA